MTKGKDACTQYEGTTITNNKFYKLSNYKISARNCKSQ